MKTINIIYYFYSRSKYSCILQKKSFSTHTSSGKAKAWGRHLYR